MFRALLIARNKVLQQWPKGAWSNATYLAEDYGRETTLLVVSRAGILYSEAVSYSKAT